MASHGLPIDPATAAYVNSYQSADHALNEIEQVLALPRFRSLLRKSVAFESSSEEEEEDEDDEYEYEDYDYDDGDYGEFEEEDYDYDNGDFEDEYEYEDYDDGEFEEEYDDGEFEEDYDDDDETSEHEPLLRAAGNHIIDLVSKYLESSTGIDDYMGFDKMRQDQNEGVLMRAAEEMGLPSGEVAYFGTGSEDNLPVSDFEAEAAHVEDVEEEEGEGEGGEDGQNGGENGEAENVEGENLEGEKEDVGDENTK
eukprot:GHVO01064097.1.p1 GENE.GHVO01064097.1~~GHVO01064097.1.p1  ORF type:complete len:253 (+),score=91.77 GHVO01064097.1:331-1089(+)